MLCRFLKILSIESRCLSIVCLILGEPIILRTQSFQDTGYKKAKSDPCLFYKIIGVDRIYIRIHVDDTFVAATSEELLQELEDVIKSQYKITVKIKVKYDVESSNESWGA